jgi:predicted amidohydrolase
MRVGVIQLCSNDDLEGNLEAARLAVDDAARLGCAFVALPENFAYLRREGTPFPCAQGFDGPIVGAARTWARTHGIWLLGGSFPEAVAGEERVYNTSFLVAPDGEVVARYRKIHLFDVKLGDGANFTESKSIAPVEEVTVAETPFGRVGLSVCYDVRFPELYRSMGDVRMLCVPSAFAPQTGKDHWEVLLRARAIENQCFVLAPAQCGRHSPQRASHGRSLIVDPWGLVLAQAPDTPCALVVDCDLGELERVRRSVPALCHRRL